MNRWLKTLGLAMLAFALVSAVLPAPAQAQVIVQQAPVFAPPVVTTSYYPAVVAAPVRAYAAPSISYYRPAPVTTYYAPRLSYYPSTVTTFAAPAAVVAPAPGLYTTYTYRGFGVFRPRGFYNETHYTPVLP